MSAFWHSGTMYHDAMYVPYLVFHPVTAMHLLSPYVSQVAPFASGRLSLTRSSHDVELCTC